MSDVWISLSSTHQFQIMHDASSVDAAPAVWVVSGFVIL